MKLEALIFDVDGTFAETEELHRQAFNRTFDAFGLGWHWGHDLYAALLQTTGGRERISRYVADYVPEQRAVLEKLTSLHEAKTRSYLDLLARSALTPRPGVKRLIDEARARDVGLAIATTSMPVNVEALLRSTLGEDSVGWFVIAAGDAVETKKPHPGIYFEALKLLGVGPTHAVAVEDSSNGVQAALGAGLKVVATPSAYLPHEDLSAATAVVSDLGEPTEPFQRLAGATFPRGYVDVDGLEALLDAKRNDAV